MFKWTGKLFAAVMVGVFVVLPAIAGLVAYGIYGAP